MKIYKKITLSILLILIALTGFAVGYYLAEEKRPSVEKVEGLANKESGMSQDVDFSVFWEVWNILEEKYVGRNDLDREKMIYGAAEGMVKALGDPYTVFMEPVESKKFQDDISGSFSGIGAEIGIRKGVLTIISPLKGTPADKAGLKAGDKILKIDDVITIDLTIDEAVNNIRGERGTEVILLVAREEWNEAKEIAIVRDTIAIPILDYSVKESNIGYLQIYNFTSNLTEEFEKQAKTIQQQNLKGLVIDLRNNPGGYLEVAVDIASCFLEKDEIVAIEDFGNGDNDEYRAGSCKYSLKDLPLVVLVNQGSASASEILAGALRDHLQTPIVGQTTFGKGSIQELEKLKGGASVKVTVAKWLTPSGLCIQEAGIAPDFEVEITQEDFDNLADPQLDKALEIIHNG